MRTEIAKFGWLKELIMIIIHHASLNVNNQTLNNTHTHTHRHAYKHPYIHTHTHTHKHPRTQTRLESVNIDGEKRREDMRSG